MHLLIGTRAGLFVLAGDPTWKRARRYGPLLSRRSVGPFSSVDGTALAAVGGALYRSHDGLRWARLGETPTGLRLWSLAAGDSMLYAGTEPAALLRSQDGGRTWQELSGLRAHPSAAEWWGPWQLPLTQAIVLDPQQDDHVYAAISVAGVFHGRLRGGMDDRWDAVNAGIAPLVPRAAQRDDVHRDVQNLVRLPAHNQETDTPPILLAATPHALYRTEGDGRWVELVGRGAPRGVRALAVDAPSGLVFAVPLGAGAPAEAPLVRGQLTVCRSADGGQSWEPLSMGLPDDARCFVHRDALTLERTTTDGSLRLYLGTSAGEVYWSPNGGQDWQRLAAGLPSVRALGLVRRDRSAGRARGRWSWPFGRA